ncbi:lipoprotein-releasing ABC transporter permease subunit LolE [Corallincola holothuriorum]|uniref:Lipoprotein-releasing ABC transporter permease subunit LolE n=1 Tax=Corallincola holothuriorum TaxID=2282215 RepID=A0A368NRM6_9GAMM|nr:lipoprotein-releasing ABC transporter permease subunit LolE [Corallincola holothuriorum]RCU52583.1 lipoprotein-releasing ABC transporter permease subunit LolE [Corallincola holothuriorum]
MQHLALWIAFRFSRARQRNRFISFISASSTFGIALGVMVLITLLSAMNGFEQALKDRLLSVVPHGEVTAVREPIVDWKSLSASAIADPAVVAAAPFVKFNAMLERGGKMKAIESRGVDLDYELDVSDIGAYLLPEPADTLVDNELWLGKTIADELSLAVGDKVMMLIPTLDPQMRMKPPKRKMFVVKRLIQMGGELDASAALISIDTAAELSGWQGGVQGIRFKFGDVMAAPRLVRNAAYEMAHYLYISDWTRTQGHLYSDIQLVRGIVYMVLTLVIAVASFNIVSTLVLAVQDKQSEIAILKTMGTTDAMVMKIFILQGLFNGVLGSLIGAGLGVLIASSLGQIAQGVERLLGHKLLDAEIYFIDFLPSLLSISDVVFTVIVAIALSLLATLYPAWKASKILPANVLGQSV